MQQLVISSASSLFLALLSAAFTVSQISQPSALGTDDENEIMQAAAESWPWHSKYFCGRPQNSLVVEVDWITANDRVSIFGRHSWHFQGPFHIDLKDTWTLQYGYAVHRLFAYWVCYAPTYMSPAAVGINSLKVALRHSQYGSNAIGRTSQHLSHIENSECGSLLLSHTYDELHCLLFDCGW